MITLRYELWDNLYIEVVEEYDTWAEAMTKVAQLEDNKLVAHWAIDEVTKVVYDFNGVKK